MDFLNEVTTGVTPQPLYVLLMGTEKIGKSTWASKSNAPIFLGAEPGSNNLNVARFPLVTEWAQVDLAVEALLKNDSRFADRKTLVVDTIDSLEPIQHMQICKDYAVKSIELANGGFGAGLKIAIEKWNAFLMKLERLRNERGMNIILLAHTQMVKRMDPMTNVEFDRYEMKLHKSAKLDSSKIFIEHVDNHLFMGWENYRSKTDSGVEYSSTLGVAKVYTERRPAFDAGNRFSLPFEMTRDFGEFTGHVKNYYVKALKEGTVSTDQSETQQAPPADKVSDTQLQIEQAKNLSQYCIKLLADIKCTDTQKHVKAGIEKAGQNLDELTRIKGKLETLIG